MITGKDLKRMVALIPDEAGVVLNGNWNVSIEGVTVETTLDGWIASLNLTKGFSITSDEVLNGLFKREYYGG